MDAKQIVRKYGLTKIERNGKQGVQPTFGKITKVDADYILSHKDEIFAAIAERDSVSAVTTKQTPSAAEIAYRKVAELEGRYRQMERNDQGSVANIIAARNAYEQALREWQAQYPEAAKSSRVHYNDGATNNPWTN